MRKAAFDFVRHIMAEFADSTGLTSGVRPRRYLWTDSFAVCNFLGLYRQTGDEVWLQRAVRLVDQVHHTLGRHREDDPRSGWISGLSEEEGNQHPTAGGLRIGKRLNERKPGELVDDRLEWERDGQYFHYLTKWMHALDRVCRVTGNPIFNSWAVELAQSAHAGFLRVSSAGSKRMYWKMSIDLSYPLVHSMGQHDPLDGWITYTQLRATAAEFGEEGGSVLASEIADMQALCRNVNWATEDPLGIGGLLGDGHRIAQLTTRGYFTDSGALSDVLHSALPGLSYIIASRLLNLSADYRLAFRELGLSIGLHAVEKTEAIVQEHPAAFCANPSIGLQIGRAKAYVGLIDTIEKFWLDPTNRTTSTWNEHLDINRIMLATSLAPDAYLDL